MTGITTAEDDGAASAPQVLQTLAWMRRNKFKPVPLHHRKKAAASRDYTLPGYAPPPDAHWHERPRGVGVLCGPSNDGPIDIDLDCMEAVHFAPIFLPPTQAVFGRRGKPRSHYLYRSALGSEPYEYAVLSDPRSRLNILEIRADGGHQTVMPGSLHEETGEEIAWDAVPFPEVAAVHPDELALACKKVAIATLISRHMWDAGQRNEVNKLLTGVLCYLGWPIEDTKQMIQAVMDFAGDEDPSRIRTIEATYRRFAKNSKVAGTTSLRRHLGDDRLVDRILQWIGPPEASLIMEMNELFAVVDMNGKYRVASMPSAPGEAPCFYAPDDFLGLFGDQKISGEDGKMRSRAAIWLNSPRRRRCSGVDFMPGLEDTGDMLNLWTGWAVRAKEGDCSAWLELLERVIAGDDADTFRWLLHWFANIVREPASKSMTSPVFIGRQGAGKSMLLGYFGDILGKGYTVVSNPDQVTGQFNAHLATTLLLHSEEALFGHEKRHRGIIKSLITDEWRIFEPKGVDRRPVRNYLRLVLSSNDAIAAPVEAGDRRFSIISLEKRGIPPSLVKRVLKERREGGPAALLHHLLTMDYDPAICRTNLKNDALAELKPAMGSPVQQWWYDKLCSGKLLPEMLDWAQQPEGEHWPPIVGSVVLYEDFRHSYRGRYPVASPEFYVEMRRLLGIRIQKGQRTFHNTAGVDGARVPVWVDALPGYQNAIRNMPDLATCRRAFEDYMGQEMSWPEGEDPDDESLPAYRRDELRAI